MRELVLTKNKVALVDDEDYYWLAQFNWFAVGIGGTWYARRSKKKGRLKSGENYEIYLHRIVARVTSKDLVVHHKDHNGLNNQKDNLIECFKADNNKCTSSHRDSSSTYLGVSRDTNRNKWQAQLMHNGKKVLTRRFNTEEAAIAYNNAAKIYYGEFANLNRIK